MASTLAEIDHVISEMPGARIVAPLKITESGVDPIGLRQLNLDLMAATIPGINNVTVHIRAYSFMAWAWWKAGQVASTGNEVAPAKVADLAARYETMYAWAHSLAAMPFRGAGAIRKYLPLKGSSDAFIFEGAKWEEFKRGQTSFMNPTEYGPSIKALHFLKPELGAIFAPSKEVEKAVKTIDEAVSACIPMSFFELNASAVHWEDVIPLAEVLPIGSPSIAEKDAFRFLFYEAGSHPRALDDMRRRRASIDLLRSILPEGEYIGISEIRRRLAAGHNSQKGKIGESEVRTAALMFSVLQARQLQRLATEAMMLWVETKLSDKIANAKSTEELVEAAHSAACLEDEIAASSGSIGQYMQKINSFGSAQGWPAAAALPDIDLIGLIERLSEAQRKNIFRLPALALRAFGIVYAMTKAFRVDEFPKGTFNPIDARPDRLPMGAFVKRIDSIKEKPLPVLWRDVIEHWIIAQHVHWSAVRGADGKKRLRIGLEGAGWFRVRARPSRPFRVTPDRLVTLLSLGCECGLFVRSPGGDLQFGRSS